MCRFDLFGHRRPCPTPFARPPSTHALALFCFFFYPFSPHLFKREPPGLGETPTRNSTKRRFSPFFPRLDGRTFPSVLQKVPLVKLPIPASGAPRGASALCLHAPRRAGASQSAFDDASQVFDMDFTLPRFFPSRPPRKKRGKCISAINIGKTSKKEGRRQERKSIVLGNGTGNFERAHEGDKKTARSQSNAPLPRLQHARRKCHRPPNFGARDVVRIRGPSVWMGFFSTRTASSAHRLPCEATPALKRPAHFIGSI